MCYPSHGGQLTHTAPLSSLRYFMTRAQANSATLANASLDHFGGFFEDWLRSSVAFSKLKVVCPSVVLLT